MTTIISLPDLHGEVHKLDLIVEWLSGVDLIILPGDLTTNGGAGAASQVMESLRRYNQQILAVPGNWDGPGVSAYLDREGINLDRRTMHVGDLALIGVGGSLHSPFNAPNEYNEEELAQALQEARQGLEAGQPSILICHQPPSGTRNARTSTGLDVGSTAIRSFIETHQPLLCLTGHIHEGIGIDTIGATRVVNPGPLWQTGFAFAEIVNGNVIDLELRMV